MPLIAPEPTVSADVAARAAKITALVLDVDGVLTDGRIIYDEFGDELKFFDVQDGAGLAFWHRAGFVSAIISGRKSKLVARRAKEMGVQFTAQKHLLKLGAYEIFLKRFRLTDEQVCAIGDDLMELPILRRAGLAVAVPNAVEEVRAAGQYVTSQPGGHGAVREVINIILKSKGLWQNVIQRYM